MIYCQILALLPIVSKLNSQRLHWVNPATLHAVSLGKIISATQLCANCVYFARQTTSTQVTFPIFELVSNSQAYERNLFKIPTLFENAQE